MNHDETFYTVGEVAQSLQITVRTLHHWEAVGLIEPTERSWSNYRLYTPAAVQRVQQILLYRATGMQLAEIKRLLEGGSSNLEHLLRQRESLLDQQAQLADMVQAIDKLLENEMHDEKLDLQQIGEILGDANFAAHQAEAEERYGDTDDWVISQARSKNWNASDWEAIKSRFEAVDARLVAAVKACVDPDSAEAAQLVEMHRAVINTYFPVSHAKHYLISRCYVADERFKNYYDSQHGGLAQWLADAIEQVAAANGVDLENPELV